MPRNPSIIGESFILNLDESKICKNETKYFLITGMENAHVIIPLNQNIDLILIKLMLIRKKMCLSSLPSIVYFVRTNCRKVNCLQSRVIDVILIK